MKTWRKKDEWTGYASCLDDSRFISEDAAEDQQLRSVCSRCLVRPECMSWAVEDEASSVFVAGIRLPDPSHKRALKLIYERFRASVPGEMAARGEV